MKSLLTITNLRWLGHGALLVVAFMAGKQFRPVAPVVAPQVAPKTIAKASPPRVIQSSITIDQPIAGSVASPQTPQSRLTRFIDSASHFNDQQVLGALRKLDLQNTSPEAKLQRHILLGRYAELDPQTALTYVDTLSGSERDDQMANVLTTWASRDPAGAASHFQTNSLSGGIASDEDRATAASIAAEWAKNDPKAALNWSASLPEEVRAEARGRILASLAASNPQLAAQTASTLPAGYERTESLQPLAAQWAQSSPTQAASWVQTLANPTEQASAASGLVSTWMNTDPMAASQWVSKLKPGPVRDAAIGSLVQSQSLRNDPEAATLWANTIQDQTLRQQLLTSAAAQWQRQDAHTALSWKMINGK